MHSRRTALVLLILASVCATAQEVRFIDMTAETPRTELRYPPAPPPKCDSTGHCVSGSYGSGSVADGAPDFRDPHALALVVVSLPAEIDFAQPVVAEFRLINSGLADIELPISPDLSNLQPPEASRAFDYKSLDLAVRERKTTRVGAYGAVTLYGSPAHPETLLTLKPGQWIRVRGILKWSFVPQEPADATLDPVFTLRDNTYTPHPGGSSTAARNLYPNVTRTPEIHTHFSMDRAPVRQ